MKRIHLFGVLLLISCSGAFSSPAARAAEAAGPATAAEAVAQFFAALAAEDVDRAIAMTAPVKGAPVKGAPAELLREYYQGMAEQNRKAGRPSPPVVAHLRLGDTAVVIFNDTGGKKIRDLDPAYLIQREGRWLVLFKLTRFDRPEFGLDEATLAKFRKLAEWYKAQEPALRELIEGGA